MSNDFDDLLDSEHDILDVGIKIASFYDHESGELRYAYDLSTPLGAIPASQAIGMLEYIKHLMLQGTLEEDPEE